MKSVARQSPFLQPGSTSSASSLAVLHLRRDQLLPTILQDKVAQETGYAEGAVSNTRFGSYPHSTLIGLPWGSQVLASKVDTGTRGRKGQRGGAKSQKRKSTTDANHQSTKKPRLHDDAEDDDALASIQDSGAASERQQKSAVAAASGFCHILPPTPETWTISLPHRTQIVYTSDYSFVLQKLRVRPGSVVIEAGAGSGSFTHAAARAVFNGYLSSTQNSMNTATQNKTHGQVFSYEYHAPRAAQLVTEIDTHGLSEIVHVSHRDVYADGFLVTSSTTPGVVPQTSPNATAVFLDLPAPWLALPHLSRHPLSGFPSPLSPHHAVHLTCFLPCIEQTQRAITTLRTLGWVDVCMYAVAQRRIDVRRERVGLDLQGLRGVNAVAKNVEEALERLREVDSRSRVFRVDDGAVETPVVKHQEPVNGEPHETKQERLARIKKTSDAKNVFLEGRLVHRTEPDIKTHTSYLVFATLPMEWSEADEAKALANWGTAPKKAVDGEVGKEN